ncbi:MAG TPA: histidine kinase dimerization/phospho-acceptor domain-containing protein [Rubrivivax sp.]|nr:histidine kinase dimerization/phospho-acceptor domain-containing protein [Rubrivivax sp.]
MKRGASLQLQLLAWALGALIVVWAAFVFVGYRTGVEEADELTDGHLASVASLLLAQPRSAFGERPDAATLGVPPQLKAHDYQHSLSVAVWDRDGRLLAHSGLAPVPGFGLGDGFATLTLGTPPQPWRVFTRWDDKHDRRIAVLLSLQERDELVKDIAAQITLPGLWLLPVVALGLTLAIRRGLAPLHALSASVRAFDIRRRTPLHAPPHREFQVMVAAIDTLAGRWNTALEHERELADSFAHELRTPLASLRLHADAIDASATPAERDAALAQIRHDAARAAAVIDDLLALARASRSELADAAQELDLATLARRVAADYGQAAFASGHTLAVDAPQPVALRGHPVLLEIALRNLIVNALGHTPPGTGVEIRVGAHPPLLEVSDDGPRRAPAAAARHASAAVLGLGLGHQVVRRIAAVHGGSFEVIADPSGLRRHRLSLASGPASPEPPVGADADA